MLPRVTEKELHAIRPRDLVDVQTAKDTFLE